MKRFCQVILFFLVILCCINICLDLYVTHSLQQCQSRKFVGWSDITQKQLDADLLIMGNSRAWSMYSPAILDSILHVSTYNLGMDGSPLNRQIMKYDIYRHFQQRKPRYVIMNIDYMTMGWRFGYEREQFFPYLANPFVRRLVLKHEHFVMRELYLPMYRYYSQGLLSLMDKDDTARFSPKNWYKGYWGYSLGWDGEEIKKVEKIEFKTNASIVEDFDAFLSELQKDGVKVIFVSSPICAMATKKLVNPSEFYEFRDRFSEKYNIPVLDYIDDAICNDTTYFSNATHLNRAGAELFTTKLCQDLDSLGLLRL